MLGKLINCFPSCLLRLTRPKSNFDLWSRTQLERKFDLSPWKSHWMKFTKRHVPQYRPRAPIHFLPEGKITSFIMHGGLTRSSSCNLLSPLSNFPRECVASYWTKEERSHGGQSCFKKVCQEHAVCLSIFILYKIKCEPFASVDSFPKFNNTQQMTNTLLFWTYFWPCRHSVKTWTKLYYLIYFLDTERRFNLLTTSSSYSYAFSKAFMYFFKASEYHKYFPFPFIIWVCLESELFGGFKLLPQLFSFLRPFIIKKRRVKGS